MNGNNVFQHPYFSKLVNNDNLLSKQIYLQNEINNENNKEKKGNKINTRNDNDKINTNITGQSNQILKIKIIQANHKLSNNDENKKEKNNEIPKNK